MFLALRGVAPEPAIAHEIGTTRVTVRFPTDDTFRIEVVTDAQALLEKLEALAGTTRSNTTRTNTAQPDSRRFVDLQEVFLNRVDVMFDTEAVRPDVQAVFAPAEDENSAPVATVTLLGQIPAGARQLTWKYGWTFSKY